jgi:hypothetical protein
MRHDAEWFELQLARIDQEREADYQQRTEMRAELLKQRRLDRLAPYLIIAGMVLAAIIYRLPEILAAFGVGH